MDHSDLNISFQANCPSHVHCNHAVSADTLRSNEMAQFDNSLSRRTKMDIR